MITFFLIIALIGTIILVFHISIELNNLEIRHSELTDKIRKHYELKSDT
jgi:hypothetical protein